MAIVHQRLGDESQAESLHREALDIYEGQDGLDNPFTLYIEARYAALTGDREAALRHLRESVVQRGFSDADAVRADPHDRRPVPGLFR